MAAVADWYLNKSYISKAIKCHPLNLTLEISHLATWQVHMVLDTTGFRISSWIHTRTEKAAISSTGWYGKLHSLANDWEASKFHYQLCQEFKKPMHFSQWQTDSVTLWVASVCHLWYWHIEFTPAPQVSWFRMDVADGTYAISQPSNISTHVTQVHLVCKFLELQSTYCVTVQCR